MEKRKSQEEDDKFLQSIENVADNLSNGVDDLQRFVLEYKASIQSRIKKAEFTQREAKDTQRG